VISNKTQNQVEKITKKQIKTIPFWVNDKLWFQIKNKDLLFDKYNLDKTNFYIGSFQRDTEGKDLVSPKLSKGPDQFLDIVKFYNENHQNLVVLLAGKRRQYLINNLKKEGIQYKYLEMVSFEELNELYNLLNLYIVSSRFEGGPQAIMECAITKTPIISTDVGIASEILSKKSIYTMDNFQNALPDVEVAYKKIQKYKMPEGFNEFNKMFKAINEN
jgi:glycosyltransferase involved in cell wall biosynthesis